MSSKFEFIAGSLSLDFVDTLGGRGAVAIEKLNDHEAFRQWLQAAGLEVSGNQQMSGVDLDCAIALREAIYRAAQAAMSGSSPARGDVAKINAAAMEPPLRPQLVDEGVRNVAQAPLRAALSTIAADAIAVLGQRKRLCECQDCRMLFIDKSRAGRRRWCSSSTGCGNRAKVRNHRKRRDSQSLAGE